MPLTNPYLKQQTELSQRRLNVETIDLLYLHRLDPDYPIADLAELRDQGKIPAPRTLRGRHPGAGRSPANRAIAAVQNLCNLSARDHDLMIDHTVAAGIAFIPFFPLAMTSP